jgi:hypothetical protein
MLTLLVFIGEATRDALDPRHAVERQVAETQEDGP